METRRGAPGLGHADTVHAEPARHADRLLASSLLFADGRLLRDQPGDCRKLLVAILYARKWLHPTAAIAPLFPLRDLEWVEPLASWTTVPASALPPLDDAR